MEFESGPARERVERMWALGAQFGFERAAHDVFLNEVVSDRYALVHGLQVLRDELQFAGATERTGADIEACGADLRLPSVVTTVARTTCGDRIHQGESMTTYTQLVAARFATLSEVGDLKVEAFSPTGGGVDDGATLAHVTVAHQLDEPLRRRLYESNPQSCALVAIDVMAHVGRLDEKGVSVLGRTRESPWRQPRAACGAIVSALEAYNPENGVHRRLRRDLGEENFAFLVKKQLATETGTDLRAAVAASIVAIRGMRNVLEALAHELDERGLAHVTASLTVNRVGQSDTIIYLARGTAFGGELRVQGLGTQAKKYSGRLDPGDPGHSLELVYGDADGRNTPVGKRTYKVRRHDARDRIQTKAFESQEDDELPPMGETLGIERPDLPPPGGGRRSKRH